VVNWDAIGALAELAGAVAVVLSLVYLAIQIRQNTAQMESSERASRGAAYQGLISSMQSQLQPAAQHADLSEIIRRGLANSRDLDEAERFRFNWLMGGQINCYENAHYQYQHGVVSEERWQRMLSELNYFVSAPGYADWWDDYAKGTLSPDMVKIVDEMVRVARTARKQVAPYS
jgi:hypothetical protein